MKICPHCEAGYPDELTSCPVHGGLLSEIREVAERPSLAELRARLERRAGIAPSVAPAQAVRDERDSQ